MSREPLNAWLERWRLTPDGDAFTTPFGSRLMPVIHAGRPAMLKIAVHEEERRGGALMAWWAGLGAARVLAREGDALLLERLSGPRSLAAMARCGEDDEATTILCRTAMALHAPRPRPPPATFVPLPVWFRDLEPAAREHGGTFAKALAAAGTLLEEARDPVVLHGDFHHGNVLDGGERGWLVIDPKGVIGDRAFEYANLFRNPDADLAVERMGRRVEIVSGLTGIAPERMLRWILAYAGLGAAWSLQSGHDPAPGLAIAERAAAALGR